MTDIELLKAADDAGIVGARIERTEGYVSLLVGHGDDTLAMDWRVGDDGSFFAPNHSIAARLAALRKEIVRRGASE